MDFTLTLNIEPSDLDMINGAQQKIALAKPVGESSIHVIWMAFSPFEYNTIQWSEEYGIYVSGASPDRSGEKILKLSEVKPGPAISGAIYTFQPTATFSEPLNDPNIESGTFAAKNNMPYEKYPGLTFGLSQSVEVNQQLQERMPISAVSVLANQRFLATPFNEVYIWLESQFDSSTIVTEITARQSVAKFGNDIDEITMTYDSQKDMFIQQ